MAKRTRSFRISLLCATIGIFLIVTAAVMSQSICSKIELTGGDNEAIRKMIAERLTTIVNSMDEPESVAGLFASGGYESFCQLLESTGFRCVYALYKTNLLALPGGGYEVRNIRVCVEMGKTEANPDQDLVFSLDSKGYVTYVRFAMEKHLYQRICKEGKEEKDFANRQIILQFVELFRTAYNRKDIEYLEEAFSDDALIIVGRVLEKAPEQPEFLKNSRLDKEKIRFVKLSKAKYLKNLSKVFTHNDFIKVDFDSLKITRDSRKADIYGVKLKQRWRSSTYSDEGYLFLMIDFSDAERPLIHVRTWQPTAFQDGSVINLYDFNILE
ncbi:MAG: hypothetical protein U9R56_06320 [candidate division Zixibacteria bacterium]|nr:hypothetical protein [candidate division Zixibacteria bacterium]